MALPPSRSKRCRAILLVVFSRKARNRPNTGSRRHDWRCQAWPMPRPAGGQGFLAFSVRVVGWEIETAPNNGLWFTSDPGPRGAARATLSVTMRTRGKRYANCAFDDEPRLSRWSASARDAASGRRQAGRSRNEESGFLAEVPDRFISQSPGRRTRNCPVLWYREKQSASGSFAAPASTGRFIVLRETG
jgi:hypothetical protein